MEGLVHKSKGFLPVNLSNPKGESFDVEERKYLLFGHDKTSCVGEGRSKAVGLKEKLVGGFSRGITLGCFKSSNRAQIFACSFH